MIQPEEVWVVADAVDGRLGIDGLSILIQNALGKSPCDGTAYAFRNRRSTRIKLLVWDGNGVWLCQRRLHEGSFVWPAAGDMHCALTRQQWEWLVSGVDWRRLGARPRAEMRV